MTTLELGLRDLGYIIETHFDPKQALENYSSNHYDLLIIDIHMPLMDGFKFFKAIQKINPEAKALFITAYETSYFDAFRELFPELDIGHYVKKPMAIADIAKQINLVLGDEIK